MQLWFIGTLGQPQHLHDSDAPKVRRRLNGDYFMQELADNGDYGDHYIDIDLYTSESDAWRASISNSYMGLKRVEEQHETLVNFARKRGFAF
jgi:hypothetical protein